MSLSPVGMMTSLTSGLPSRETCTQPPPFLMPITLRSAVDQMPITWLVVSTCEIGICSAIVCTA